MRIIGIESADKVASIAIIEDDKLIGETKSNGHETHSVTLMPMLDKLVKEKEIDLKGIDAIAVSKGPGSYTGLRIGASTAKGLALILKKPIIPISTLLGMACSFWGSEYIVVPMLDARRGNAFAAAYTYDTAGADANITEVIPEDLYSVESLFEKVSDIIKETNKEVVFLGSGSKVNAATIIEKFPDNSYLAPEDMDNPSAKFIALYGVKMFKMGAGIDGKTYAPNYLRPSQAERQRDEK